MIKPTRRPTRGLSREILQLMLEMNSLLRRYDSAISLTAPDVYEQFIQASETIEDADILALRGRLIAAFTGEPYQETSGAASTESEMEELLVLETLPEGTTELLSDVPEPMTPQAEPEETTADTAPGSEASAWTPGESQSVFLKNLHKQSRLTCNRCKATIVLTPEQLVDPPVEVVCTCGHGLQVDADGRRFSRRETNLSGQYVKPENGETGTIVIENISFGGIRFRTENDGHGISHDDRLQLQFTLDDEAQSVISNKISVRYVLWNTVGAKFIDTVNFDQKLAAYLMRS